MSLDLTVSRRHLDDLRNEYGLYYAALSDVYHYVWLRDSVYVLLAYEALGEADIVRAGAHAIYDRILIPHGYKIDWRIVEGATPVGKENEYLHPRYLPDGSESPQQWGWTQHDAVGAILWAFLRFEERFGGVVRNENIDRHLLQRLVWYLQAVEVYDLPDNGVWEEARTIHLSTLAACYAGLNAADRHGLVVDRYYLARVRGAITALLPRESLEHKTDMAMLTAVWPFGDELPLGADIKTEILTRVGAELEGPRGVARYLEDIYDTDGCHQGAAQWPLGFGLLALGWNAVGDKDKARAYLEKLEAAALPDGELPEAWCHDPECGTYYNSPLGWTHALHLTARSTI